MRFPAAAVGAVLLLGVVGTVQSFQPATPSLVQTTSALFSTAAEEETQKKYKKEERLRLMKSDQFFRKGFKEVREDVEDTMSDQFKSEIVDELKQSNYVMEREGVKVYLAKVRCLLGLFLLLPLCSLF